MRASNRNIGRSVWTGLLACTALAGAASCSRDHYRTDADKEVTQLVAEKSVDPRWALPDFTIEMDPRSRYFDPWDRDFPPMPPDDPASHQYMVQARSVVGTSPWDSYGHVTELENPGWEEHVGEGLEQTEDGKLLLRLEDAIRLALVHSPSYQSTLETLYLSALDVSTERFRFDVQFFGGLTGSVVHRGSENPGGETNTAEVTGDGRLTKSFAAGGELLISMINSIGINLFGPNDGFAASQLAFSFVQPLLRGFGRAVTLEQLTIAERGLLANLRAFQLYRQGFYTSISIGESGVTGPQRRGGFFGGTGLTGFTGTGGGFGGVGEATGFGRGGLGGGGGGAAGGAGFAGGGAGTVGGFIGLLQQTQQIRNTSDSLNAQLRTLALLEANLDAGLIDIAQVDQFRQNIESERANLLQARNGLLTAVETFNRSTLGLPPDLPIEPDDTLIRPFQLIDPSMTAVQNEVDAFIDDFGLLPEQPEPERLEEALRRITELRARIVERMNALPLEFQELESKAAERTRDMTEIERKLFDQDRRRLVESLDEIRGRFAATEPRVQELRAGNTRDNAKRTADEIVKLLTDLSNVIGDLALVQARARLEKITVEPIDLSPGAALEIARATRLDWMNNRAALVDSWRLIEFNANALLADMNVRLDGNMGTIGGENPVKFRDETATLRAGLEVDGPFTRLQERNNFRQQLISYQQDRRQLIQFEDGVKQTLQARLRELEELRVNLEIQRRAVIIAIRRVDQTRDALNRPVPPAAPGAAPQALGPTAAQNLLFALSDLRTTQNNLMSVWLNYLAERMRLYRDLGIMQIDEKGLWIDEPLQSSLMARAEPPPPEVPSEWIALAAEPGNENTLRMMERGLAEPPPVAER